MNRLIPWYWLACVVLVGALTPNSVAMARGKRVTIDFVGKTTPPSPLPAGIRAIEVRRPTYQNRGGDDGYMIDDFQQRAVVHPSSNPYWWWWRWSGHQTGVSTQFQQDSAYRKLLGKVRDRIRSCGSGIVILEVEDLSTVSDEFDRRRARGEASGSHQQANLSPDAFIMVRIGMEKGEEAASRTTSIDKQIVGHLTRRFTGGLFGRTSSREQQMVRTLTMTAELKLTSFRTTDVLASYTGSITKREGTDSGWFGFGQKTHADFDPVAEVINEMIEQHVSNFVRQFLPMEERVEYVLSNVNDRVARDVNLLNSGYFEGAGYSSREAWYASHERDHAAAFVAGIAAEMIGEFKWAAAWYSRAWGAANGKTRFALYKDRLDRVKAHRSAVTRKQGVENRNKGTTVSQDSDGVVTITPN